ncbi:hypothetical protein [Thermoleptolyngbya sp. M55_K2018_002]|uniref:hypothetical protein n=1 Tax=Thermoleptolyngbya sp. M55_K2018_002 TaxID=2747808 RepID=UPI0019F89C47|nr:hypothetical protein [Thermoleptolyngbya sp. M55_K2018_002]HIK40986.1 hypothetical protein [Thermoleptolyngbya sp. M55_K2018_002]
MIQHRKHQPKSLTRGDRLCINQQGIIMPRALQRADPDLSRFPPCLSGCTPVTLGRLAQKPLDR